MERELPKYISEIDGALWVTEIDRGNLRLGYKIKEIIVVEETPFQHLMVLDLVDFGHALFLDGVLQSSDKCGHIYNEMIVHIPMHSHPDPRRVLIIGGGDCGAAREALKYPNATIDMVEIDEAVPRNSQLHLPKVSGGPDFDPRLKFMFIDGFAHIKKSQGEYDVIIIDSSDPIGPAVMLFTEDFYGSVKKALHPDGIMVCMSESPLLYAEELKSMRAKLGALFSIVQTYWFATSDYPGGMFSVTLASDTYKALGRDAAFDKPTRYICKGVLASCTELPPFVEEMLK